MSEPVHDELRIAIGAYALGHLDPDEAATVRAHLETCGECRADYDEIAPVAAALGATPRPDSDDAGDPPSDLNRRIEERIRASHRTQTRGRVARTAVVGAITGAAAAAVLVVGLRTVDSDAPPAVPLEAVAVTELVDGVVASADVVDHTWGVELKLEVTGLDAGAVYDATVLGLDGREFAAGAFVGTGENATRCNLNAGVVRTDAAGFEIRDSSGEVVIRSEF